MQCLPLVIGVRGEVGEVAQYDLALQLNAAAHGVMGQCSDVGRQKYVYRGLRGPEVVDEMTAAHEVLPTALDETATDDRLVRTVLLALPTPAKIRHADVMRSHWKNAGFASRMTRNGRPSRCSPARISLVPSSEP